MEHLNESFLGVFEHLTEAIRKLGLHAMGIDEEAVRREAMDQLAMALQCLSTGEAEIRELLKSGNNSAETDVGIADAQGKAAPAEVGTSEPHAVFQTEAELISFVEKATNAVNGIIHEEQCRKGRENMLKFKEKQELKRQLLGPGEIYVDAHFLEEAHESICEILERLPDVDGNELVTEINEAAIRVWSRLNMVLRWGAKDTEEDIDTSDNESAESAQVAENSHGRVQQTSALEGVAQ